MIWYNICVAFISYMNEREFPLLIFKHMSKGVQINFEATTPDNTEREVRLVCTPLELARSMCLIGSLGGVVTSLEWTDTIVNNDSLIGF